MAALWFEFRDRWGDVRPPATQADYEEWRGFLLGSLVLARAVERREPFLPEELPEDLLGTAESMARRYSSPELPAQALWLGAESQVALNRLDTAETFAIWALDTFPGATFTVPMLWRLRADVARVRGRWDTAYDRLESMEVSLDAVDRAVASFPAQSRPTYEAFATSQRARLSGARGQLWLELGVLDVSREQLLEGERLAAKSGVATTREALLGMLLDWEMESGDYAGVIRRIDALGEEPFGAPLAESNRAVFAVMHATAEHELGRTQTALETLHDVLESPHLDISVREGVHLRLAGMSFDSGDFESARSHLQRAALLEASGSDPPVHRLAARATLEGQLALAEERDVGELRETLAFLRSAHSRLLDEWAAAPMKKQGAIGFLHTTPRRGILSELFRLLIRIEGEERGTAQALQVLLATQAMGTLSRDLGGAANPTLADVRRELLHEGSGALFFLPSEYRSHLFLVDADSLTPVSLPSLAELRAISRPFERALQARTLRGRELHEASKALADALLPARARERIATWSAVTVIGADLIGPVPFDALVWNEEYLLGEAFSVATLPSASLGLVLLERRRSRSALDSGSRPQLALLGTLDPGDAVLASLGSAVDSRVFDDETARGLVRAFDPNRVRTLLDRGCRPSDVRRERSVLNLAAIVHFVAHGVYARERDRGATLALTPEKGATTGLYTCDDVERDLDLSGLVILSACGTALGPRRLGDDELSHLGGAFLRAGADAVVLSRSFVSFDATMQLMERFHQHLARGEATAEAMRRARRDLHRRNDWSASFQRAQFQVLGLGHEPALPRTK